MATEPAASARSLPQRSGESSINGQIPNLEVGVAATGSGEQAHLAPPAVTFEDEYEAGPRATSISSFVDPTRQAQSLQEARHVPGVVDRSHEPPATNLNEASSYQERDLERAEPIVSSSIVSSGTWGQTRTPPRTEPFEAGDPILTAYNQSFGLLGAILNTEPLAAQYRSLIDSLRSIAGANGEEIYRKYAMGFGRRKRYGWFVEATLNKIAMLSSNQHKGWFVGGSAILLQHLISRWVHSGHRKCFQTSFCDKTAVYLLQNIGDPSDRWLGDTLRKNLGMNPRFLDEHLALVYDGSRFGSRVDGDANQQVCPRTWHIWATFSDQRILRFNSLTALPPSSDVALIYISFQRTDTDSCKSGETNITSSCC